MEGTDDEGTALRKMVAPAVKREAVAHLKAHLGLSEQRVCQGVGADGKMVCDPLQRAPDMALHSRLQGELLAACVTNYNTAGPHSALGYQTPAGLDLHQTTVIARPAARKESSARRAIPEPASKDGNKRLAPVAAG